MAGAGTPYIFCQRQQPGSALQHLVSARLVSLSSAAAPQWHRLRADVTVRQSGTILKT